MGDEPTAKNQICLTTVDPSTFRASLLSAMRAGGARSFNSYGRQFHLAFCDAVQHVIGSGLAVDGSHWIRPHPMTGYVNEAGSMILEGMHDRVIVLEFPGNERARFIQTEDQAMFELRRMVPGWEQVFLRAASLMHERCK